MRFGALLPIRPPTREPTNPRRPGSSFETLTYMVIWGRSWVTKILLKAQGGQGWTLTVHITRSPWRTTGRRLR